MREAAGPAGGADGWGRVGRPGSSGENGGRDDGRGVQKTGRARPVPLRGDEVSTVR
jgi:hypothetical protein